MKPKFFINYPNLYKILVILTAVCGILIVIGLSALLVKTVLAYFILSWWAYVYLIELIIIDIFLIAMIIVSTFEILAPKKNIEAISKPH